MFKILLKQAAKKKQTKEQVALKLDFTYLTLF